MAKRRTTREGYVKLLMRALRQRTKAKGEPGGRGATASITANDILAVWPLDDRCPILGTAFVFGPFDGRRECVPSLDRIDSKRGYVRGNIAVISWRANTIKNDATLDELQRVVRWLKNNC